MALGTCVKCGRGWPDVKVDTYWDGDRPYEECDPCLLAEMKAAMGADRPDPGYAGGWDNEALAQARMGIGVAADW